MQGRDSPASAAWDLQVTQVGNDWLAMRNGVTTHAKMNCRSVTLSNLDLFSRELEAVSIFTQAL